MTTAITSIQDFEKFVQHLDYYKDLPCISQRDFEKWNNLRNFCDLKWEKEHYCYILLSKLENSAELLMTPLEDFLPKTDKVNAYIMDVQTTDDGLWIDVRIRFMHLSFFKLEEIIHGLEPLKELKKLSQQQYLDSYEKNKRILKDLIPVNIFPHNFSADGKSINLSWLYDEIQYKLKRNRITAYYLHTSTALLDEKCIVRVTIYLVYLYERMPR